MGALSFTQLDSRGKWPLAAGGRTLLSMASTSAPASISAFTISEWPWQAAMKSGVTPSARRASFSAPAERSALTTPRWPF